jgi:hypothetical protein
VVLCVSSPYSLISRRLTAFQLNILTPASRSIVVFCYVKIKAILYIFISVSEEPAVSIFKENHGFLVASQYNFYVVTSVSQGIVTSTFRADCVLSVYDNAHFVNGY